MVRPFGGNNKRTLREESFAQVKLDPTSVDAWNALGHCYWKRGDLAQASSCFTESKSVSPNPTALQNLSMLKRQMMTGAMSSQQLREAIEASVALAKEALALDVESSYSWCKHDTTTM